MATKIVRRSADVPFDEAFSRLVARFPNAKVASFGLTEDKKAYEAKLVSAEFPPGAGDDDGGDSAPSDDAPPADDGGDDSDDSGDEDGPPKKKEEKGGEAHAISELTHLVKQVALAVGVPPEGPTDPTADPNADPGMEAGPMPPAGPDVPAPLPPPAKPGGGGGGPLGTPFSKVAAERRSFVIWREPDADGTLPTLKTAADEVRAVLPQSHKLAKITMERAKIDGGEPVNVYVCAITAA